MVTVQFFKTSKVDNAGRMGNFASETEQESYFSGLTKLTVNGARMNNLGEPIEVQEPWTTMLGYSYGRFQVNNVWIYFSVADIEPINDSKTRVSYNIDCWETCRHQFGITLGRGKVERSSRALNSRLMRPFNPLYGRTTEVQRLNSTSDICAIAYHHDNETNVDDIYVAHLNAGVFPQFPASLLNGWWLTTNKIDTSEIVGCWLSPWNIPTTGDNWTDVGDASNYPIRSIHVDYMDQVTHSIPVSTAPIGNDEDVYSISDMKGSSIWSCDRSNDFNNSLDVRLNIGANHCYWICQFSSGTTDPTEGRFTIPCEPSSVWNDAFVQYQAQQRAYDIELRQLNNERQLQQSLLSIGSSAVQGAIGGGIAGIGAGVGAVAGAVVQGVTAGIQYQTNVAFGNREQAITDRMYQRQSDTLNVAGDANLDCVLGKTGVSLLRTTVDSVTSGIYNDMIDTAGYYYDLEVLDMEDFVVDGPLTASVEVLGSIPDTWKAQIQARIAQGVIFV